MQLYRSSLTAPLPVLPVLAAGLAALTWTSCPAAAAPKEVGIWIDNSGDGAVKIEPCGDKLCGRIIWLKNPLNDKGLPKRDRYNPDEARRNRPICGLPILGELAQMPEGGFDNGWVYDPKEGKSYSVAIVANGSDQLSVTGYKGVKFLGKTFTWTRATTALPSCEVQPASAKPSDGMGAAGAAPIKAKKLPAKIEEAEQDAATMPAKPDQQAAPVDNVAPAEDAKPAKKKATATPPAGEKSTASEKTKPKAGASEATAKSGTAAPAAKAKVKKPADAAPASAGETSTSTSAAGATKKKPAATADAAKTKKPAAGTAKATTTEVLPWATGQ